MTSAPAGGAPGQPAAPPTRVQAVLELRRSSASARHTPTARKGTRAARRSAAFRDQD